MRLLYTLAIGLSLLFTSPSFASTEERALKQFVTSQLAYARILTGSGMGSFELVGETQIEERDNYYRISLPQMRFEYLGAVLKIDPILINARKGRGDTWNMTMALPNTIPIEFSDPETDSTENIGKLQLGRQDLKLIWHEKINLVNYAKMHIQNVSYSGNEDVAVQIGDLSIFTRFTDLDKSMADFTSALTLSDIKIVDPSDVSFQIMIDEIDSTTTQKGMDVAAFKEALDTYYKLSQNLADTSQKTIEDSYDFKQLTSMLEAALAVQPKDYKSDIKLVNLEVVAKDLEDPYGYRFGTQEMIYAIGYTNEGELANANIVFNLNSMKIEAEDPETKKMFAEFDGYFPKDIVFDLKVDRIPFEAIMKLTSQMMNSLSELDTQTQNAHDLNSASQTKNPETDTEKFNNLENDLKALEDSFKKVNTRFILSPFEIAAPKYTITTVADANMDMAAKHQIVGTLTLKLRGLDRIIEEVSTQITQNDSLTLEQKQKAQGSLVFVPMLKGMGKPIPADTGEIIYHYEFALAQDGSLTMNGQDLSAFAPMLGGNGTVH